MVFNGYTTDDLLKHINHKNGIKIDNDCDNLEFCTPTENIEHALESGLSSLRWTYGGVNCVTGETFDDHDLNDLRNRGLLSDATAVIELFREKGSTTVGDWVITRIKSTPAGQRPREILEVLDTETKKVEVFKKKVDFMRQFDVGPASLIRLTALGPAGFLPGRKLLRVVGKHEWPTTFDHIPMFEFGKRPVLVRNVLTKEVLKFEAVTEAAKHLRITKDALHYRLFDEENRIWPDMTQCQYEEDFKGWRDSEDPDKEIASNTWRKEVDVRDVRTGSITRYNSRREAAKGCGVVEAVVSTFLAKDAIMTTKSGHQFKLAIDDDPWPPLQDPILEIAQANGQRPIVAKNSQTGQEQFFISSKQCALAFNVPASNLCYWLKKGTAASLGGGWSVSFYTA